MLQSQAQIMIIHEALTITKANEHLRAGTK